MARPTQSIGKLLLDAGLALRSRPTGLLLSERALAQRIEFALRQLASEPHKEAS